MQTIQILRWVAFGLVWVCAISAGFVSMTNVFAMVEAVNKKLPEAERFESFGWGPFKTDRLHRQYRKLYPSGSRLRRQAICDSVMCTCFALVIALIGLNLLIAMFIGLVGNTAIWAIHLRANV